MGFELRSPVGVTEGREIRQTAVQCSSQYCASPTQVTVSCPLSSPLGRLESLGKSNLRKTRTWPKYLWLCGKHQGQDSPPLQSTFHGYGVRQVSVSLSGKWEKDKVFIPTQSSPKATQTLFKLQVATHKIK